MTNARSVPAARRPRPPAAAVRGPRRAAPVLVRQVRGEIVESIHRGHVVRVDAAGLVTHVTGDPEVEVTLRSAAKPFGLAALAEAGGFREFGLAPAEIALMAGSHSGEDLHVRTLQAVLRRSGLSQSLLACGVGKGPIDALTAARLARDGERAGPVRHMCSGYHVALILLARLGDWTLEDYWTPSHPVQGAVRSAVARALGTEPERLQLALDNCGVETFGASLASVARAFALLADPDGPVADDGGRRSLAPALREIRDAMVAHPEMVGGTRDRLDTALPRALPGRLVVKGGAEGLRGIGILGGASAGTASAGTAAAGMAVKVEDGAGLGRATWAVSIEALRLAGVLEGQALRVLARYHRPVELDPHGRVAAESIAGFELVPVGELVR